MARRTRSLSIFAALLALILAFWAPAAVAHHKDDHNNNGKNSAARSGGGNAGSDANTYTEDNDNDGLDNQGRDSSGQGSYPNESRHPSGKDRYVEGGGSGNQGNSQSDPDDDGRGPERCEPLSSRNSGDGTCGPDKPNGSGGEDIYDQDGNNGCGNDQDFDDDNEGWCGKPTDMVKGSSKTPEPPCDADAVMPGIQKCDKVEADAIVDKPCPVGPIVSDAMGELCDEGDDVEGAQLDKQPATPGDSVLGVRVSAAPAVAPVAVAPAAVQAAPEAAGGVLPFTGAADLFPFVAVALMLIGIGALSLRARRNDA